MFSITRAVFAAALVATPVFAADQVAPSADLAQQLASKASLTSSEIAQLADSLNSPAYVVLFETDDARTLEFGAGLLQLGDHTKGVVAEGEELARGVYWNFSTSSVFLGNNDGVPSIEVPAGGIIVVGALSLGNAGDVERIDTIASGGPSVTCGAGFYACCQQNQGGSSRTAKCIANGTTPAPNCTHGGPGATSCSFGSSSSVDFADVDSIAIDVR